MKKRFIVFLSVVNILFLLCSCASSPTAKKSVIVERDERMFWEINSPTGTKIYVLGTIHVGDEQIAAIEPTVMDAFLKADARYGELSLTEMMSMESYLMPIISSSLVMDEEGKVVPVTTFLTEDENQFLEELASSVLLDMGLGDAYSALSLLPPWYWNNLLDSIATTAAGFDANLGIDMILYAKAMELGLEVLGLDAMETQLEVLTFGTTEDHVAILKDAIASFQTDNWADELLQLADLYVADDKEGLALVLKESDLDISGLSQEYKEQYMLKLINERNRSWADQFANMLKEKDKTYFVFGGAAHWLYSPSVFEMLVQDGVLEWQ